MARYILAIDGLARLHVGEAQSFQEHVGVGSDGAPFDPARVIALAEKFELYDEDGHRLAVVPKVGGVDIGPVEGEPADGAELVARITFILAKAQDAADVDRRSAVKRAEEAVGALAKARDDGTDRSRSDAEALFREVPNAITALSDASIRPFPVVQGDLRVVLAALAEDFGGASHGGPKNRGDDHHNKLHEKNMTHP